MSPLKSGRRTTLVAQIDNLLFRRLAAGRLSNRPCAIELRGARRMPFCNTADYQSALHGLQNRERWWLVSLAATSICLLACFPGISQVAEPPPATAILQDLRSFREMGSVLFVAAHPDDENNQLIAYLARGRNYRMAIFRSRA